METDDYSLDELERSQRQRTHRRREGRARRKRYYFLITLAILALVVLAAPSFLSHSPMGRSMVQRIASSYGVDADIDSLRVGWITPLSISGVYIKGQQAGSEISIDQVDTSMTVTDLLSSNASKFGNVVVRGVDVRCSVANGTTSLEQDLQTLLEPSEESDSVTRGSIEIQDATIAATDSVTGGVWQVSKSNATLNLDRDIKLTFAGVLTEPSGSGGAMQGTASYQPGPTTGSTERASPSSWKLNLECESLPLSVVTLAHRRFPSEMAGMPGEVSGDATGAIQTDGLANGRIDATFRQLQVRNLRAIEPASGGTNRQTRVWKNALASLDGKISLAGDRVIGQGLTARADFASATLDGAFSRSITFVGDNNNPLRWLEALDGTALAEVDIAQLNKALPGLLPLRQGAELISGRAVAKINTLPAQSGRRSQLTIRSEPLRARARGRAVVIQPIEIDATVLDNQGQVRAEAFQLKSSFASAVGKGDLRSGSANFSVDLGRLSTMLRPIIDMSQTSLGGSANGHLQWNASNQNLWRLTGNADANNILVTLPSGQSLKRNSIQAKVDVAGRWTNQSLSELSTANLNLQSTGLQLTTTLAKPVQNPSSTTLMPLKITGSGRIENLTESLGPWLPKQLHDAEGEFALDSRADVSSIAGRLRGTKIALTNPRVAYGNRWFSQPNVKVDFDGEFDWPSLDVNSRSLTVVGNAVTMRLVGQATAENVDLEVAWQAKLERVQGSVRKRVANRPGNQNQTVGFRPQTARGAVQSDDWLVMGDCKGNFTIRSNGEFLEVQSDTQGQNIAVVQPDDASAQSYTVGPMPRRTHQGYDGQFQMMGRPQQRVVWAEPNLKINGLTRYNTQTGRLLADGMKLSGDWFATTLSGHAIWNSEVGDIVLKGPASLKMDEISKRLTQLSGTSVNVQGTHQTPLEIHAAKDAQENFAFTVQSNLGWEMGEIGGVQFGGASVPVRLTETTIEVSPSVIPVGQGQVNLAGEVFYRPGPIWLRARPGTVAQNLQLTKGMTNRWLKYLAPLAADAAQIDGTMSVELDEAIVVIDNPEQSRVRGRINIDRAQMTAGPIAAQVISGVDHLKAIALAASGDLKPRGDTKLVAMPAQTVDFSLDHGIVTHQRLYFDVDRAQVVTSGRVALDSRVNMTAQVELDPRWLGSDLKGLAGQVVSLPVTGTLSRPSLDPKGFRDIATQLGTQAATNVIQEKAENYLQKQFNKSMKNIDNIFKF